CGTAPWVFYQTQSTLSPDSCYGTASLDLCFALPAAEGAFVRFSVGGLSPNTQYTAAAVIKSEIIDTDVYIELHEKNGSATLNVVKSVSAAKGPWQTLTTSLSTGSTATGHE